MTNTITIDTKTGMYAFHPEMSDATPTAKIQARISDYGNHWFLKSKLAFSGRGIEYRGMLTADDCVPGSRFVGWHEYTVTTAAFDRICKAHKVSTPC